MEPADVLRAVPENYKGMEGPLGDKEKAAVDGLVALLAEVNEYKLGTDEAGRHQDISVHGKFTRAVNVDAPGSEPFGVWRIGEVSFFFRGAPGDVATMGGSSVMGSEPSSLGLLKACEDYLEEFHTPPYRPAGWDSDIDEKADAEWRLRWVWKPEEKKPDGEEKAE